MDEMSQLEPLEHSVLDVSRHYGITKGNGEPMIGSDRGLTFSEIPDAMRNVDLGLGAAIPDNVCRVALSPAEVRLNVSDRCIADINTAGYFRSVLDVCIMAVICMIQRIRSGTILMH